jgi:hypothetical protein
LMREARRMEASVQHLYCTPYAQLTLTQASVPGRATPNRDRRVGLAEGGSIFTGGPARLGAVLEM